METLRRICGRMILRDLPEKDVKFLQSYLIEKWY